MIELIRKDYLEIIESYFLDNADTIRLFNNDINERILLVIVFIYKTTK